MQAVVAAAAARGVPIHRVSQGSGIMLQTDDEIREMLAIGRTHGIEVCLFVGPRANWDTGVQAASVNGRVLGSSLRGADQLAFGIDDVLHGASLGLRSILVADLGQLHDLRPHEEDRRPAAGLRAEDLRDAGRGQSRDGAPARGPRRDVDQPAGRSLAAADRRGSPGDRRGHRLLRRGPGRLRRHRPALRGGGAGASRRAHLPEVRPAQRAWPLPERPAPRGDGASRCRASACAAPPSASRCSRASPRTRRRRRCPRKDAHEDHDRCAPPSSARRGASWCSSSSRPTRA